MMAINERQDDGLFIGDMDPAMNAGSPESEAGRDNSYTELDEEGFEALDEENDREVSSRGGHANLTQDVEAGYETESTDDAEIRHQELPIQSYEDDKSE